MTGCLVLDNTVIVARKNGKRLPCERLQAENTKLRELSKYAILCSEGDARCLDCPYHDKAAEPHIICMMRKSARELGVEVAL